MEAEEDDAFGNCFAAKRKCAFGFGVVFRGKELNMRDLLHSADEHDGGHDQTGSDTDGQIEKDREEEGDKHDKEVRPVAGPEGVEVFPFSHAERHGNENAGKGGERNVAGERSGKEGDGEENRRMGKSGDGRPSAIADVRGGASDSAGGGNPAEERAEKIGEALRDQFLVGVVAGVGHAIGHSGREEAFNAAERRNGESRNHERAGGFE
jgi:hypothetical protein